MENNEYLNEEKYQRTKKKINNIAKIVLLIGILIGVSLILKGVNYQKDINEKYSDESKLSITEQIENEKQNLETKKLQIEQKGIKYDSFENKKVIPTHNPTIEEMQERLALEKQAIIEKEKASGIVYNDQIQNQEEIKKRKMELMNGNKNMLKGI